MNDLIDVASYYAHEIEPDTGEKFQIEEGEGTFRDATFDELKTIFKRAGQNAMSYYNMLDNFLLVADMALVRNGLEAIGLDPIQLKSEFNAMRDVATYCIGSLPSINTKEELDVLGTYIDENCPKLTLVRRSWCLGL